MATNRVMHGKHAAQSSKELRRKASELNQDLHELSRIAKKLARDKAGEVHGMAADYVAEGMGKLDEVQSSLTGYIREKPLRSTLIAAGVGLLIGRVLMR